MILTGSLLICKGYVNIDLKVFLVCNDVTVLLYLIPLRTDDCVSF